MAEHDLYGILEGSHLKPPAPGLKLVPQNGLTAVLAAEPRPLIRLPQSRKVELMAQAERLRAQDICLPLGTFLPASPQAHLSVEGAEIFLDANRPFLFDQVARFADLVQYQLQVLWAEDQVLAHFCDAPEIAPLFAMVPEPEEIPRALGRLAQRLGGMIEDQLSLALEVQALPVAAGLLWNGALLVHRGAEAELEAALIRIDQLWTKGLTLRLTGPAPVVSFCMLELERVTSAQIDWALDRFGLGGLHQAAQVATIRRQLMIAQGADATAREQIEFQARVIEAAARLNGAGPGFALARSRAEGQALLSPPFSAVA